MDIKERFWSKTRVNKEHEWGGTPCVDWTASKTPNGYGKFYCEGSHIGAHRVAFELTNGEIADGLHVLHQCDRPECVNPEHLFLGTHTDNMRDKESKGRGGDRSRRGEKNGTAILRDEDVRLIKRFIERHPPRFGGAGGQLTFLCRWFDVTKRIMKDISRGHTWRHVK